MQLQMKNNEQKTEISKLRINKYISLCNIAPRREVEKMLKQGEFKVNGKVAEVGMLVDPETDKVEFCGKEIKPVSKFLYIKLNKPKNVLSTVIDDRERGRTTVTELVKTNERLFPIGRLDFESTGLILLTNDGDLALKLTHPKYHLPKVYEVETLEQVTPLQLKKLETGIKLDNIRTLPAKVNRLSSTKFEITLYQGMKRQIREMCATLGLTVKTLHRIEIGPIKLGSVPSGKYVELTESEIASLKKYF